MMSAMGNSNGMNFIVLRRDPVLVCPAKETRKELLKLSYIDDYPLTVQALYVYAGLPFNSSSSSVPVDDPTLVIRDALSKALVYYYPLAGRLQKSDQGKIELNCNEEGVVFVEGTANCSLEDVEYLSNPTPFAKQLYYHFPITYEHYDIPPLVLQVTRFLGGGFVLGFGSSHCLLDGVGFALFINALAQLARGMLTPSVIPVWERHLLAPRNPHLNGFPHLETSRAPICKPLETQRLREGSFFISAESVTKLKQNVLEDTKGSVNYCSRFEALAAFVWKCRVKALRFLPDQQVQLNFFVDTRKIYNPPLPEGYYGNAITCPCIILSAQELSDISLGDLVKLIRERKASLSDEYLRSTTDIIEVPREELEMEEKQWCHSNSKLFLSDFTRLELTKADFGSGEAVFLCYELLQSPVDGVFVSPPTVYDKMKDGVIFMTCLPEEDVAMFKSEMQKLLHIRLDV